MKKIDKIDLINDIDSLILSVIFDHQKVIKAHSFDGNNKWIIYLASGNLIYIHIHINGDSVRAIIGSEEKMTTLENLVLRAISRLFVQIQEDFLTNSEFKMRSRNAEIVRNERIKVIDYKRDLN